MRDLMWVRSRKLEREEKAMACWGRRRIEQLLDHWGFQ